MNGHYIVFILAVSIGLKQLQEICHMRRLDEEQYSLS